MIRSLSICFLLIHHHTWFLHKATRSYFHSTRAKSYLHFFAPLIRPMCALQKGSDTTKERQWQDIISIGRFHLNKTQDIKSLMNGMNCCSRLRFQTKRGLGLCCAPLVPGSDFRWKDISSSFDCLEQCKGLAAPTLGKSVTTMHYFPCTVPQKSHPQPDILLFPLPGLQSWPWF